MKRWLVAFLAVGLVVLGPWTLASAGDSKDKGKLKADPFVFIGKANDCGTPYPAGSHIVTAAWLGGMGLPDDGIGPNTGAGVPGAPISLADFLALSDPGTRDDPHQGLLLSKNGPTFDCSSAGAEIKGVKGMKVTSTFALGYDYRNGGHCGAGAPRFNVDTDMGFFFVGCANAPQSPAPQDPLQWTRTRSTLTTCDGECFPGPIPVNATIKSINIIFDEGTDTANNDTLGVGLAVLDNILIDTKLITAGHGIEDGTEEND